MDNNQAGEIFCNVFQVMNKKQFSNLHALILKVQGHHLNG